MSALALIAAAAQARPAELCARQLQAQLRQLNGRIQSFHIIYEAVAAKDAGAPAAVWTHRELAACSPGHFSHFSAKRTAHLTPEHDPLQQRLIVNGDDVIVEYGADRAFIRAQSDGHLPGSAPREIMFPALGWWPLHGLKTPQLVPGTAVVLCDVADSGDYRVWPELSRVGDTWCHVLEHPNRDRLWIDTSRGCMIMAREILEPTTEKIAQRIETAEPTEVAASVWAPMRLRNLVYDRDGDRLAVESHLVIRKITVNDAGNTPLLEFQPRPGSIELRNGSFIQCAPGGLDHLDQTASRLKQFPRFEQLKASSSDSAAGGVLTIALFIAFGALMTFQAMRHPAGVLAKLRSGRG